MRLSCISVQGREGSPHRLTGQPQMPPVPSWVGSCAGSRAVPLCAHQTASGCVPVYLLPEKRELFEQPLSPAGEPGFGRHKPQLLWLSLSWCRSSAPSRTTGQDSRECPTKAGASAEKQETCTQCGQVGELQCVTRSFPKFLFPPLFNFFFRKRVILYAFLCMY